MFHVDEVYYPQAHADDVIGYQVNETEAEDTLFWVNKFLHWTALRSKNTSKQYAYRLCRYLNYLKENDKNYISATTKDLRSFILSINLNTDGKIVELSEGKLSESTLKFYLNSIRRFYSFLEEQDQDFLVDLKVETTQANPHRFLYGNVWDETVYSLNLESEAFSSKEERSYERWYTDEQVEAILDNFNTERDRAIFSLSLDGLRIDEILSLTIDSLNLEENEAQLNRSKGRRPQEARKVVLKPRTVKYINDYLFNEREEVEAQLIEEGKIPSRELFLNLVRRSDSFGRPVSYNNWLKILKKTATRAGLDPKRIRTHSGRSTRAQELFNLQASHPGELTDSQITDLMGWSRMESAEPYKNTLDRQTALEALNRLERKEDNNERD